MSSLSNNTEAGRDGLALVLDEAGLVNLAGALARLLAAGDCVVLRGELGTGKTTFARALIRTLLADPLHDVPSPTFALRQDYDWPGGSIFHVDLYRIGDPSELDELALDEAFETSIAIIEWPEKATDMLPASRVELSLMELPDSATRRVVVCGIGASAAKVAELRSKLVSS